MSRLLDAVESALDEELPIRCIQDLSQEQRKQIKAWGLITAKPLLYIANVDESQLTDSNGIVDVRASLLSYLVSPLKSLLY